MENSTTVFKDDTELEKLLISYGFYLGRQIVNRDLIFLNIDSIILNSNVIYVSEEEKEKFDHLEEKWYVSNNNNQKDSNKLFWKLLKYRRKLEIKYLPNTIETYLDCVEWQPNEEYYLKTILYGINNCLWESDTSHYMCYDLKLFSDDNVFKVILKRQTKIKL